MERFNTINRLAYTESFINCSLQWFSDVVDIAKCKEHMIKKHGLKKPSYCYIGRSYAVPRQSPNLIFLHLEARWFFVGQFFLLIAKLQSREKDFLNFGDTG